MKLNVGCGSDTWGDIRLDVSKHHWMTMGKSSVNLIADAQCLPFKDKCFDELRAHQVLEHIRNWKKALRECCRVAKKISITVPVDSYMPRSYIRWFLNTLTNPKYMLKLALARPRCILKLKQRAEEHLWQFNIEVLTFMIRKHGFHNVHVNIIYNPIFGFFAHRRKCRYFHNERFRKAENWVITAF